MALGTGPGAGSRASMAKVIIGGQTLCLLLSLLVTPVAYSLFDDAGKLRVARRVGARFAGARDWVRGRLPATNGNGRVRQH
jgi:HAE1 family hydrophobic/amphiphilic exporter-1